MAKHNITPKSSLTKDEYNTIMEHITKLKDHLNVKRTQYMKFEMNKKKNTEF